jgi:hypothetical protein
MAVDMQDLKAVECVRKPTSRSVCVQEADREDALIRYRDVQLILLALASKLDVNGHNRKQGAYLLLAKISSSLK